MRAKSSCKGFLVLFIKDENALSPFRAPYGGFELDADTNESELNVLVEEILAFCKSKDLKKITIVSHPDCYDPEKSIIIKNVLLKNDFLISTTELNYHLIVDNTGFESKIHSSEKRKLKKCRDMNFSFSSSGNDYHEMYQLIVACRKRKGFPISMNKEEFSKMFESFPDRYIPFTLRDGDKLIATAIGVKVNDHILYNFLPADYEQYLSYSPMVLLKAEMYRYCQDHQITMLDYGIGTAAGIKNEGLIRFKENMGGLMSHKNTYEIML